MESTASFEKTQSIQSFAKANSITGAELVQGKDPQNPREGAFVAFDNGQTARLSKKLSTEEFDAGECNISWFVPENGEPSWLVHPKGEGRAVLGKLAL